MLVYDRGAIKQHSSYQWRDCPSYKYKTLRKFLAKYANVYVTSHSWGCYVKEKKKKKKKKKGGAQVFF